MFSNHLLAPGPNWTNNNSKFLVSTEFEDANLDGKWVLICKNKFWEAALSKEIGSRYLSTLQESIYYLGTASTINREELIRSIDYSFKRNIKLILVGFETELEDLAHHINSKKKTCLISNKCFGSAYSSGVGLQRHLSKFFPNEYIGLGKLKESPINAEAFFREATLLNASMNVLKRGELPMNGETSIHGITSETFCLLMKYAGTSPLIKVLGLSGYSSATPSDLEIQLTIDAIWYFMEGYQLNVHETPNNTNDMQEYIIHSQEIETDFHFVKSKKTGKIWFKGSKDYIPCSEEDYKKITANELPDWLLKNL